MLRMWSAFRHVWGPYYCVILFNHGWGAHMISMFRWVCLPAFTWWLVQHGRVDAVHPLPLCTHTQDGVGHTGLIWGLVQAIIRCCTFILPVFFREHAVYYLTFRHERILHSNWDSPVLRISANNSWVICTPCRPLAFLFNLLGSAACSFINNTHRHVC